MNVVIGRFRRARARDHSVIKILGAGLSLYHVGASSQIIDRRQFRQDLAIPEQGPLITVCLHIASACRSLTEMVANATPEMEHAS
jgi:hypothetical protein